MNDEEKLVYDYIKNNKNVLKEDIYLNVNLNLGDISHSLSELVRCDLVERTLDKEKSHTTYIDCPSYTDYDLSEDTKQVFGGFGRIITITKIYRYKIK